MVEPRHHTPRSDRPTRGHQVARIAEAKRAPLMPWQRQAVDVALEVDPATGLYHYGIVVVTVPRQAGKTKLESDVADHRCLTLPRARVWITMQSGKAVDEWMREEHFTSLASARVFGVPGSSSAKYTLSKRAGSVGVKWPSRGSTFTTFPPRRDSLHSKQSDLVFVDEAWVHDAEAGADLRQAIRPTMNTRPGAQLWIVSTEGDDSSVYLDDYISLGRDSLEVPGSRVCFIDYGIPDDADPENLEVIAAHHPAYGLTFSRQALEDAREEFRGDPAGWARAYGNRRTRTRATAINAGQWAAAGAPFLERPDRAGIALDATPTGDRYALGAAWDVENVRHIELVAAGRPDDDAVALIAQIVRTRGERRLVVDRASIGALDLVDRITRDHRDLEVVFIGMHEYAAACVSLVRRLAAGTIRHANQRDLDDAVESAVRRDLGDGAFGWGRKAAAGSIAELVAVTVAGRAFDTLPAPRRKPVAHA